MNPRLLLAAGAILASFACGWMVNGWRMDAEALEAAEHAAEALRERTAERDALAASLRASNDQHAAKLKGAQDETNRLRDCLRSGTCGLRIGARCPAPETPAATGVDSGAGAVLDRAAESAYFALRDGIDRASAQLEACQAELKLRSN